MQHRRLCAILICLLYLTQNPYGVAQDLTQPEAQVDFSGLGQGTFTVETGTLEKGSFISLETDLQEVVAIVVEDTASGRELVRLGTAGVQPELREKRIGNPDANVVIEADSIQGRFGQKMAYDLKKVKSLQVTLMLADGRRFPFNLYSKDSVANRRVTQVFGGKGCRPIVLDCTQNGGCYTTKTCCTLDVCLDCYTCTITCARCSYGGGGWGCGSAAAPPQQTVIVPLDDPSATYFLPNSTFTLKRMEPAGNVTQLMEEWAIYAVRPGTSAPKIEVLKTSSPSFAAAKSRDLTENAFAQKRALGTVLVVESPVHPQNSRFAPTPKLKLSSSQVPSDLSPIQVVVRADFSDQDFLQGLQVLHSDKPVPDKLMRLLKNRLQVERKTPQRHRTVAFMMVTIDDSIELTSLATVAPKCCCGDQFCV